MPINIPIEWNDEVGELFDKITLFTLKDALDIVQEQIEGLNDRYYSNELEDYELRDYNNAIVQQDALRTVVKYFGG